MKLQTKDLRLMGSTGVQFSIERLLLNLTDILSRTNDQVNRLTEGQASAVHNKLAAVPTTGAYTAGDFIKNATPSEQGSIGAKYVVEGWLCVAGGDFATASPPTFVEKRFLTGN
jgi:hypothetical protein